MSTSRIYYRIYQEDKAWIVEDNHGNKASGKSVAEAFEKLNEIIKVNGAINGGR